MNSPWRNLSNQSKNYLTYSTSLFLITKAPLVPFWHPCRGLEVSHAALKHLWHSSLPAATNAPAVPVPDHFQPHRVVQVFGGPCICVGRWRIPVSPCLTVSNWPERALSASVSSSGLASSILITGLKFVLIRFPVCPASMEAAIAAEASAARTNGVSRRYTSMALVLRHRPRARTVSSLTPDWNAHSAPVTLRLCVPNRGAPWVSRGSPAAAATLSTAAWILASVIRCPISSVKSGALPLTTPVVRSHSFLARECSHSRCTGHYSDWRSLGQTQSRATVAPWPCWSVLELATSLAAGAVPIGPSRRPRSGPSVLRSVGGTRSQSSRAGSPTALDAEWEPSPLPGLDPSSLYGSHPWLLSLAECSAGRASCVWLGLCSNRARHCDTPLPGATPHLLRLAPESGSSGHQAA